MREEDEEGEENASNLNQMTPTAAVAQIQQLNEPSPHDKLEDLTNDTAKPPLASHLVDPKDLPKLASNTKHEPFSPLITNNCAFSRKTAEFFVAQQAHLIENNEHEAMCPVDLNKKIDQLILYDPSFSDAYFLKYLNNLRLKDYPASLKALHDYFDRILLAGSVSLAALNLSSLEYRFDNKEKALFALKEAITSAHHEGDNVCLQHCLSWLYKMDSFNNIGNLIRNNFIVKSACSRTISNELYVILVVLFSKKNIFFKFYSKMCLNLEFKI